MSKVVIIIPTYNEKDNIDMLFQRIFEQLPDIHLLVVDDNSADGTAAQVRIWMEKNPGQVHLLEREGKLGLGSAYVAGFKWSLEREYEQMIEISFAALVACLLYLVGTKGQIHHRDQNTR